VLVNIMTGWLSLRIQQGNEYFIAEPYRLVTPQSANGRWSGGRGLNHDNSLDILEYQPAI